MNKKRIAILLVVIFTLFSSLGQLLFKVGSSKLSSIYSWFNIFIILGFVVYAVGAIIFIVSLRYEKLSLIYPFISLSFVWVAILSFIFLGESMNYLKIIAMALIICGTIFVGYGGKND